MTTVEEEQRGATLIVTIRREDKRNAIDASVTAGLDDALNRLEDDPALRVAVLSGGSTFFSAGADLRTQSGPPTERGGEYGLIRRKRTKPLIAAVEGFALGGGMELVLACDLVVASKSARFALPEVQRALLPISGGLFRSVRSLPLNLARELVLTGEPLEATRAHSAGFVNVLTEPGGTLDAALSIAQRIGANGPVAVRAAMAVLDELVAGADDQAWALSDAARESVHQSADAAEGRLAFLERRSASWSTT